ncbi:hypothetical protein [Deinococcus alpinitundrae]|uniref:hypothetical protein n=1 Tax=Deinococcus alpinitundrae TaxID=468913 RepID=UPI00137B6281|nr:hypothetical protein [Deinococcus alpinitundrae]
MANWLDAWQGDTSPQIQHSFTLAPGFYRFTLQSYCLHAGTYGPSSGAGYPLAPLRGDRAATIRGILQRSAQFPAISQIDVQTLIWGTEAGTRFSDYPLDFQVRVAPLMTPEDIALSFVSLPALTASLPAPVQNALNFYGQLRAQLARPQQDFAALERLAVLPGAAPTGAGSRAIPSGAWTAAGEGFYARALPSTYARTVLDVIRVAPYRLVRDGRGRITLFESGGYRAETTYDDRPGQDLLIGEGGARLPVWRFATLRLSGPHPGETLELQDRGFTVPSDAVRFGQPFASAPGGPQLMHAVFQFGADLATWRARAEVAKEQCDRVQEYRELYGRATARPSEQAIADFTDLGHYRDGIQGALQGEGLGWLVDHQLRQRGALEYATCVLNGDCPPPGERPLPETATFDPTGFVATPGNTLMQRLGISARELN